jgi:hypothetical protein
MGTERGVALNAGGAAPADLGGPAAQPREPAGTNMPGARAPMNTDRCHAGVAAGRPVEPNRKDRA